MNHLTPDPPVESSEISQQIASYREEIDFLNQGGSPQLTHKEPEMFASKKETPSGLIRSLIFKEKKREIMRYLINHS